MINTNEKKNKELLLAGLLCIVVSFVLMTICSRSSFLYTINDWLDANAYMTVGRCMLKGKVLYRDIYEHKGPYLCFLHVIACLISDSSFLGVYIFEIVSFAVFLYFSYKILRLYLTKEAVILIPVIAAIALSSYCFAQGDSAEEWCLPLITYSLYALLNYLKNSDDKSVKANRVLWISQGIMTAIVLWIKYTILGFYIGWCVFIAIYFLAKKDILSVVKIAMYWLIGIVIGSIPTFIYFAVNGTLQDLWQVYFYNLIFVYAGQSASFGNKMINAARLIAVNGLISIMVFAGLPIFIRSLKYKLHKDEKAAIISVALFTYLFLLTNRIYVYVFFVMICFLPIGLMGIIEPFINEKVKVALCRWKNIILPVMIVTAGVFCFFASWNVPSMKLKKSDYPQYEFAKIINQTDDAKLMLYGCMDEGFFLTTGLVPEVKYFTNYNIQLDEREKELNDYVAGQKADFVITRDTKPELLSRYYEVIAEKKYKSEIQYYNYYLWARK